MSDAAIRPLYGYRVVSSNGAGVHSRDFQRCCDAKRLAERLAEDDEKSSIKLGPFEIERVEFVGRHGRRYTMRRRSRWVPWNPHEDIDARQPDWRFA